MMWGLFGSEIGRLARQNGELKLEVQRLKIDKFTLGVTIDELQETIDVTEVERDEFKSKYNRNNTRMYRAIKRLKDGHNSDSILDTLKGLPSRKKSMLSKTYKFDEEHVVNRENLLEQVKIATGFIIGNCKISITDSKVPDVPVRNHKF